MIFMKKKSNKFLFYKEKKYPKIFFYTKKNFFPFPGTLDLFNSNLESKLLFFYLKNLISENKNSPEKYYSLI